MALVGNLVSCLWVKLETKNVTPDTVFHFNSKDWCLLAQWGIQKPLVLLFLVKKEIYISCTCIPEFRRSFMDHCAHRDLLQFSRWAYDASPMQRPAPRGQINICPGRTTRNFWFSVLDCSSISMPTDSSWLVILKWNDARISRWFLFFFDLISRWFPGQHRSVAFFYRVRLPSEAAHARRSGREAGFLPYLVLRAFSVECLNWTS
jgi:hypothetical protein